MSVQEHSADDITPTSAKETRQPPPDSEIKRSVETSSASIRNTPSEYILFYIEYEFIILCRI
jgi:hypothetical protein